ncbi:DMT family transporter [Brevibacillus fluminis]|uniref:DMT family transporter n=1 Tax=Brevibacillus fluminis TaxID=511487 RepID=UPI003F8CE729
MNKVYASAIGVFIAVMLAFNAILAGRTGDTPSLLIIHAVGLITISLLLIIKRTRLTIGKGIPLYLYSAGAIGIFMVLFNNICFAHLGVALTASLGLLGRSVASGIIDHFGLFGMKRVAFTRSKLVGMGLVCAGIAAMALF